MAKKHSNIFTVSFDDQTEDKTIKFKYVTSGFNNVSSDADFNTISFDGGTTSLTLIANTLYDFEDIETDKLVVVCSSGTVSGQVSLSDTLIDNFVQIASSDLVSTDGCVMPGSPNYNPLANENDGTCTKVDLMIPFGGNAYERCTGSVTGADIGTRSWTLHRGSSFGGIGHDAYVMFDGSGDVVDAAAGTGTVTLGAATAGGGTLAVKTPNTTVTATAGTATTTNNTDSPTFASYTAGTAGTGTVTLSAGTAADPADLLLHFNSDSSSAPIDATGNTTATYENATGLESYSPGHFAGTGSSVYFNGSTTANQGQSIDIDYPSSLKLDGEFTIDFWAKFDDVASSTSQAIVGYTGGNFNADALLRIWYNSWGFSISIYPEDSFGQTWNPNHPITLANDTWYHFALTRNSSDVLEFFVNGNSYGTDSHAYYSAEIDWGGELRLGRSDYNPVPTYPFKGYLDEFRIVKGQALWTSDFSSTFSGNEPGPYSHQAISPPPADLIGDTVVVTTPSKTITATAHASATTTTNANDNPTFEVAISAGTAGTGRISINWAGNATIVGDTITIVTPNNTIVATCNNTGSTGAGQNICEFYYDSSHSNPPVGTAWELATVLDAHPDLTATSAMANNYVDITMADAGSGTSITLSDANEITVNSYTDGTAGGGIDLGATATNLAACLNVYDGVGASANGAVATVTQAEIGSGTLVAYSDVNESAAGTPATYDLEFLAPGTSDGITVTILDANNVSVTYEMEDPTGAGPNNPGVTSGNYAVNVGASGSGFSNDNYATDFAAAVNAQTTQAVSATASGAVVTFIQDIDGTAGNTTITAAGSAGLSNYIDWASGSHDEFAGGVAGPAEATVSYTDGTPDTPLSVTQTATNLAACLDGNTDLGATANAGVATIIQATQGAGTSVTSSLSGATVAYTDGVNFKAPRIADYSKIATMPLYGDAAESMLQAMEAVGNDWDVEIAPGLPLYTSGLVPTSNDPLNWDAEFSMDFWIYFGDSDGPALSGKEWVLGSGPELFADSYAGVFGIQRDHDHATDNWILHMVGGAYKLTFADSVAIEKAAWHHIAITRASNGLFKMYQDTVALAAGAGTATNPPSGGVETFNNGRKVAAGEANDRPPTIVFAKAPASEFPPAAGPDNSKKDGYYQMHHLRIFKGTAINYTTAYADVAGGLTGTDRLLLGKSSINCK